jgi:hypothetical protein
MRVHRYEQTPATTTSGDGLVACTRTGHSVHPFLAASSYPMYDKGYRWLGALLCLIFIGITLHASLTYTTVTHAGWLYGLFVLLYAPVFLAHYWLCRQPGTNKRYRLGALLIGLWPLFFWPNMEVLAEHLLPHTLPERWVTVLFFGLLAQSMLVWLRSKFATLCVILGFLFFFDG